MPSKEDALNCGERETEAALSALSPAGSALTFSQIRAEATVVRGRRQVRFWRAVAAVLALAVGASLVVRPAPRVVRVERVIVRDGDKKLEPRWAAAETPPNSQPLPVCEDYALLRLREKVLARGVESLRNRGVSQRVGPIDSAVLPGPPPVQIPTFAEYLFAGDRS
jgi:hypothetical protein